MMTESEQKIQNLTEENQLLRSKLEKLKSSHKSEVLQRMAQMEATINSIPEGFLLYDNHNNILHINNIAQEILRLTEEEKNLPLSERIRLFKAENPEGKSFPLEELPLSRAQNGETVHGEIMKIIHKNRTIWISVSAAPVLSSDGIKHGAAVEFSDITKLKETELKYRRGESQLRRLADSMPQLVWITRSNGYHEYFNKRWYEFTGTKPGETYGEIWSTLLHPDDYQRTIDIWQHSLKTGEPYSIEYRFKRGSDNTYHWFLGRAMPVFNKQGKITRWFGTCTNIQELKETEEALLESQERNRLVNKATHDIIWDWDLITDSHSWNEAIEAALGKSRNELPQSTQSWYDHIHPDDRERVIKSIHHAIQSGEAEWNSEYRFGPAGGPWKIYFDRGFIARTRDGQAYRIIGSMFDLSERKKAEKALKKSEKLLHNILEVLPVGVYVADEEGKIALTNPAAEKIWGGNKHIPLNELGEYRGWWRKTGKRLNAEDWAFARAFTKGESSDNEEIDIECFDGSRKTILNFAAPVRNDNGEIISAVAASMDITQRIKVEEALIESEERIRAALEAGNLGTWELNLLTGVATRSLRHDQIWGYPDGKEEWGMEMAMKQIVAEDHSIITEAYEQAYKTGSLAHENRIVWPDGTLHWIAANGSVRYNHQGKPVSVTGVVADITERKTAEEALRQSEERFRTLADNISQLAWMADEKGWISWYNKRWFDYTGTTFEEMQGWGWTKMHHPDHIDRVMKSIQFTLDNGVRWEEIFPLKDKNGKYRWFLTRAIPIKDSKGKIIRWFGTNTDITEQRESEIQLKTARDLFENILYILAHDLKGPIANMHMATNLIHSVNDVNKKITLLDTYKPMLERMDNTIKGVTDILQVQKTEGSSAVLIDMEILINDILLEFKNELKSGELVYEFGETRTVKYIEPFLLSILRNLINNAIKYRRENVPLLIEIGLEKENCFCVLSVKDNGIGMDLIKYGNQLFTPFTRITTKKTEGTGIGLYIIKTIIEKNGGYITVESTPGEGTTFYCYLREYNGTHMI
jgi:PAS domain S-box-containing protein